jgi:hypothetical protein
MFDPNKPVQTRDGQKVRILCTDGPKAWPIVGIVKDRIHCWRANGQANGLDSALDQESFFDLVNAPKKRWVNLYHSAAGRLVAPPPYMTKDEADMLAQPDRIACVEIDWKEPA